ncbi:NAD(P)/FAD-dependent oxidoreductase [Flavilitoribacter nigricans]|uniref:Pyridine nucleotide-disulfide oxidoreductase n=1 Tax=Flavilitoribacter nigricans (strain ATCC 23147 / DSM 23189 / NBRC 102662 / NCIMB 1420 / SS-2) TaxID=1122177 RepID=A0A2D0NC20_FLAN2|nr:FAD/NAD(P)-binding oxidoreductase [Flavilitoribacter nigricans]PHN05910.1 pyridine nucleotide-disulfide oxidoreductase [Flavilitoribacter nigricans DSM 23189 = NBRC 102662]
MAHHEVLIIGGGSAGITVGAMLRNKPNPPAVTIVDPSDKHYYQPIWTLVGAGVFPKEVSERSEADYIPPGADWIKAAVSTFDPDNNSVQLSDGSTHTYDVLVVAAGIQIDWDATPGLKDSVGKPGTGVCSNYAFETVDSTFENIKNLKKGTAIFTHPSTPIKCGGAPLKITYLASDHWRRNGVANNITKKFIKGGPGIFAVPKYAQSLTKVADRYGIDRVWNKDLIEIRADKKEAVFKDLKTGEESVEAYDMIHVTPRMSAPDFIKNSPLAADSGWVSVDKETTQHTKYPNVFSLGDCSNLPTSKTGAAIRKQAPTTTENIMAFLAGQALPKHYDGYTSCPLVTGYGSLILAEFDYDKQPAESFPFNQAEERYSMYALKAYGLPKMYWHGMLKGREF